MDESPLFDLVQIDRLLSTTRAVRKRLDLERPVEREVLLDCIRLSQQAPTGSNTQGWRWIVVTDDKKRAGLGEMWRAGADSYFQRQADIVETDPQILRIQNSASWLSDHIDQVPVHVIPCITGRPPEDASAHWWSAIMGSIFPAVWSFQLALRSRGLGSVLTTFHLGSEAEAAKLLDIPDDVLQVALLPVAYTKGMDFKPATRPPVETIIHWNGWVNEA